jgi:hypothetical protein
MQDFTTHSSGFSKRASTPGWQDQLRATVRLYLSFGPNSQVEQELDELLQRSEQELLDYLMAEEPPTPENRERARRFLDAAQHQLLGSEAEVARMLDELAAGSAQVPSAPQPAPLPLRRPLPGQILPPRPNSN